MNSLTRLLTQTPARARVAPFVAFLVLTFVQPQFGDTGRYWLYLAKTLLGAWMIWSVRGVVTEMRWRLSFPAVLAGVLVAVLWVGLDELLVRLGWSNSYPKLKLSGAAWNPHVQFGQGSALTWFFLIVRILGSSLVVPPLEEVFFRSFLYRYLARVDFQSVRLGEFLWMPLVVTSVIFGFEHREWLAGIVCGFVYQGLVCWKKRLGDAMTAHAITNFLLGLWVVWQGAWHYW